MKRFGLVFALVTVTIWPADAKIGDPPEAYRERFGAPAAEALDAEGTGVRIFHAENFKEIRVNFFKGVTECELYKYAGEPPVPDTIVEEVRKNNIGDNVSSFHDEVRVDPAILEVTEEQMRELDRKPTGGETTYTGQVKLRNNNAEQMGVLSDHGTVVELPMTFPSSPRGMKLTAGQTYSVTVLEQLNEDVLTPIAVVSKREHVDWHDCVEDAGLTGIQQLVRITQGDTIVFDRSVCEVHHVKMELRSISTKGGTSSLPSAVRPYCLEHFPHSRDFLQTGCMPPQTDFESLYVCPRCVAECNAYKRQHPDEVKDE